MGSIFTTEPLNTIAVSSCAPVLYPVAGWGSLLESRLRVPAEFMSSQRQWTLRTGEFLGGNMDHQRLYLGITLCSALMLIGGRVAAQAPTGLCFRPRPRPACSAYMITEFGVGASLSRGEFHPAGPLFTWELGGMKNLGERSALGVAVFVNGFDLGTGLGVRPRFRRWLSQEISLDVAPGIILSGSAARRFSGQAALEFHGLVAATLQAEGNHLFVGGRLGALPGTITGVAAPVLAVAVLMIACGRGACGN